LEGERGGSGRKAVELTNSSGRGRAGRRAMGAIPEDKGGWKEDGFIIIINFWSDSSITVEQ
jgi:hypothetical protein